MRQFLMSGVAAVLLATLGGDNADAHWRGGGVYVGFGGPVRVSVGYGYRGYGWGGYPGYYGGYGYAPTYYGGYHYGGAVYSGPYYGGHYGGYHGGYYGGCGW